jgi:acetyltransferase-like isoleucine patch superfamily enzyme
MFGHKANKVFRRIFERIVENEKTCGHQGLRANHTVYDHRKSEIGAKRRIPLGEGGSRGNVFLGRWTYYGNSVFSGFHSNDLLAIGSFCSIADNVRFQLCLGHHFPSRISNYPVDVMFLKPEPELHKCYTKIGNDVWIGANATILPGLRVGNGAIIGAGSVVVRDVEDFEVVAGNPAKHIKWRLHSEALRELAQQMGWWEWPDDIIFERGELFFLPIEEALALAEQRNWIGAKGVPASYLEEIGPFFSMDLSPRDLEATVREFLYKEDSGYLLHQYKSLSYENLAVWVAMLQSKRPKCILEFGTQTGCSSKIIARLCRRLGLETRIVTINVRDELIHRDPHIEYVIDDLTDKMNVVWKRWDPDIIFQDAHMWHLIQNQITEGTRHRHTLHVFHDVGFRLFKKRMNISIDDVPTGATGSWERHVLAEYAPRLLETAVRDFEDNDLRIRIFDGCSDSNEYGLGILEFKT